MSTRRETQRTPDTEDLEGVYSFHGAAYVQRREAALTKGHFLKDMGVELRWTLWFKSFEWLDISAPQKCLLNALALRMEYDRPGHPFLAGNAELGRAASIKSAKTLAKHVDALYKRGFIGYSRDPDSNGKTSYRILWANVIHAADEAHSEWAARYKSRGPAVPQIHEDVPDVLVILEEHQDAAEEPSAPSRARSRRPDLDATQDMLNEMRKRRAS
jgi:hypothetical protein